jgi:ATP-dependent exoDNAse (exonuclease V) beta subunit
MLDRYSLESFTEDGLEYLLTEQGQKFASVTTILKVAAQFQGTTLHGWKAQRSLNRWKAQMGEVGAAQIRYDAQARGREFHQRIANYLCGGQGAQWPQDLLPFGRSIKPALFQIRPIEDVLLVEGMVFHPRLYYAGKVDAIAKWQGEWSLIEWKTASRPQQREWISSHILQSAAYLAAANQTYKLELKQSLIVIANPSQEAQIFLIDWKELQVYFRRWLSHVRFFWAWQQSIDIQTGEQVTVGQVIYPDGSSSLRFWE